VQPTQGAENHEPVERRQHVSLGTSIFLVPGLCCHVEQHDPVAALLCHPVLLPAAQCHGRQKGPLALQPLCVQEALVREAQAEALLVHKEGFEAGDEAGENEKGD